MLSQWAFALVASLILVGILVLVLRSIPAKIRMHPLCWLIELAVLPIAISYAAAYIIAVLDLAETDIWYRRVQEVRGVLLAVIFAYLANRTLTLFVWNGPLQRYTGALPGIVRNLLALFIYLVAVYVILAYVFEQPVTGLLVSSGIALGVLGLAFQSTLSDIIAGISIAIERPFEVGDWIESESGICGKVQMIDWRATTLRTISNTTHVVPNNKIANTSIHNLSRPGPTYCLKVFVSVSAEIPPWEVSNLLLEAAIAAPLVADTPPPIVRIFDAQRRPIQYLALLHCADYEDHPEVRESFLHNAWKLLERAGVEFATDTRQIEVKRSPALNFQESTPALAFGNVELFAPLTADEKDYLLSAGATQELPQGMPIVRRGEEGQSFFVILSGQVRVFLPPEGDGGQELELAKLGAGSYFGEMSLLTGEERSASVSAHTRTRILEVPKSSMATVLGNRPELAEELASNMAQRKLATEGATSDRHDKGFSEKLAATTRELVQRIHSFFREDSRARQVNDNRLPVAGSE